MLDGLAILFVAACAAGPHASDERLALVVGNGAYRGEIPLLDNPPHDAAAIAAMLQRVGFDTTLLLDANRQEMETALAKFAAKSTGGALALVYDSGHAIELPGGNLPLPVDFQLPEPTALDAVRSRAAALAEFDAALAKKPAFAVIMLDACRSNPFAPEGGGAQAETRGTRRHIAYASDVPGRLAEEPTSNVPSRAAPASSM